LIDQPNHREEQGDERGEAEEPPGRCGEGCDGDDQHGNRRGREADGKLQRECFEEGAPDGEGEEANSGGGCKSLAKRHGVGAIDRASCQSA
jgi:hypothetical protein